MILFSRIALKDVFDMLNIHDFGMIYLHHKRTEGYHHFARVSFSRNSAFTKFRKNKTLAKISKGSLTLAMGKCL